MNHLITMSVFFGDVVLCIMSCVVWDGDWQTIDERRVNVCNCEVLWNSQLSPISNDVDYWTLLSSFNGHG